MPVNPNTPSSPLPITSISDHPSHRTIRIAAIFFFLSALFEGLAINTDVIFSGEFRSGFIALLYHVSYIVFFLVMGFALWRAAGWTLRLMGGGVLAYTIDKASVLLEMQTRLSETVVLLDRYGLMDLVDVERLKILVVLPDVFSVVCWWGFLAYLYYRRDYFRA